MRAHLLLLLLAFVALAFADVSSVHVNEDIDMDIEDEVDVEDEAELEDTPIRIPALTYLKAKDVNGVVQLPISAIPAIFGQSAVAADPYDQVKVVSALSAATSGWALKQQGAVPPANVTDLFNLSYDAISKKKVFFNPYLISKNYNIRHYSYVTIPGFGPVSEVFKPLDATFASFGVHPSQVKKAPVDYTKSTADGAASVYNSVKELFVAFDQQPVVVFLHGAGMVPFHAAVGIYPDMVDMIHGVIAISPIYGGTLLTAAPKDLEDNIKAYIPQGPMITELSQASRKSFVAKYPLDVNALRILTVSTHDETPFNEFVKSTAFIKSKTDDLSDGVTALADQLIPGSRCIILNAGHFDLNVAQERKNIDYDQQSALQAIFYSFFKTTP